MSQLLDFLKQRRSIRKYTSKPVPNSLIRKLFETASYAPSAHNAQPWRFIVITETEEKTVLAKAMAQVWLAQLEKDNTPKSICHEVVSRSIERFTSAPVLILACLALDKLIRYPDVERQSAERDLGVQSLSAAIQALLLAAHANGLGSCWYCAPIFCKPAVRRILEIPENVSPQALITLGYPDQLPKPPPRNPVEAFAFKSKWGISL